jgi:hypothetical protein
VSFIFEEWEMNEKVIRCESDEKMVWCDEIEAKGRGWHAPERGWTAQGVWPGTFITLNSRTSPCDRQ